MKKNYFFIIIILSSVTMSEAWWFNLVPVKTLIEQNPNVVYQKCFDEIRFCYEPFPLSIDPAGHPNQGFFNETFILKIPKGTVQLCGFVLNNNQFINELIWKGFTHNLAHVKQFYAYQVTYVRGSVAVISQPAEHNYWHWITEVLCRLALLEMQGIDYDYLYVPQHLPFMKETLELWGINPNKIIVAQNHFVIQADQLIVPSLVSNVSFGGAFFSCYAQAHLIEYVREKLLSAALKKGTLRNLCKRVFISRKDAPQRQITNEDEVFQLFQASGFERYELGKLSVTDQILLFHNAEIIVSPQGTGLANSIFCKERTKIFELFQGLNDCTFWYLSQDLNLDYTPIKTTTFLADYYQAWALNTYMPLSIIKTAIDDLNLSVQ